MIRYVFIAGIFLSCSTTKKLKLPPGRPDAVSGTAFYKKISSLKWSEREPLILNEILSGNIPSFLKQLVPIHIELFDSLANKKLHATFFVTRDYLAIGSNKDFVRTPMTPMLAQRIADSLNCFLPTKKMVNDIYTHARIKLEPVPLVANRDSAGTFYEHNLLIEGQRKKRRGLVAGIKKDVVISSLLNEVSGKNSVAIYGWHRLTGIPIQPLYTGHVNWYVDYSHGIRLIYRMIIIDGKQYDYIEILKNKKLYRLLCDEPDCSFYRY